MIVLLLYLFRCAKPVNEHEYILGLKAPKRAAEISYLGSAAWQSKAARWAQPFLSRFGVISSVSSVTGNLNRLQILSSVMREVPDLPVETLSVPGHGMVIPARSFERSCSVLGPRLSGGNGNRHIFLPKSTLP
jgi:hypothetical protein